jgi:predicted chitinase
MTPELKHLEAAGVKEPAKWLDAIVTTCQEFGIDTDKRIAAFLAQSAHESAGYTALQENLNYRAAVLATCWPKRFAQLEAGVPVDKAKPLKDAKGKNIPTKFALALEKHPEQIPESVTSNFTARISA